MVKVSGSWSVGCDGERAGEREEAEVGMAKGRVKGPWVSGDVLGSGFWLQVRSEGIGWKMRGMDEERETKENVT